MTTVPAPVRAPAPPLLLLVLLAAQQPLALNFMTPAAPGLARALDTDFATIQLTLSLYLIAVAVTQLVSGPLSDRYGRRPVVLAAMALYTAGCLLATLAGSATALIMARCLQGAGAGSVFALVRAVIRDTAGRDETASRIGYLTTVMIVVPMLGPMVGGVVDRYAGWRAIFGVMAAFGGAALAIAAARLAETNLNRDATASPRKLIAGFAVLLRMRTFVVLALVMAATSGAFFVFVGASPYVVVETMGRGPEVYGLWFVVVSIGYMAGNFCSGRFAPRLGSDKLLLVGTAVSVVGMAFMCGSILTFGWHPAALFTPMLLFSLGNGLTLPSATAAAISVRPDLAGAGAGLSGCVQLGLGAVLTMIASIGVVHTPWALPLAMATASTLGLMGVLVVRRLT